MGDRKRCPIVLALALLAAIAGCTDVPQRKNATYEEIGHTLDKAVNDRVPPPLPDAVSRALVPPLVVEMPKPDAAAPAQRFDLNVNNAPANQVFMAIVSGTPYSMVVHPDVKDPISVSLKNVTVFDALETIRDLYGYEYRIDDKRITVLPRALQTRVFQVNYLQAQRRGKSDVRVSSGSITDAPVAGAVGSLAPGLPATQTFGAPARLTESTRVTTTSESNFWGDLAKALNAIVGTGGGREVIVSPQSGVVVVKAMPRELRQVQSFLTATQLVVDRQVMLEAKIIEVTLRDGFEAGVNWAAFPGRNNRGAVGVVGPGATIGTAGALSAPTARAADGSVSAASALTANLNSTASSLALGAGGAGGLFGLALQTSNFAALIAFLENQGSVNVLSSPRVAALNNQKAVLKVGTDEFFVTNVTTTSTTSGTSTTIAPTISVQPFFSGIALDVTPQIDADNNIILHIHPSVSSVVEKRKIVDLGELGTFTLPLASSDINETDTVVRVQDSNIVAIGGLMRTETETQGSQIPGVGDAPGIGALFRQRSRQTVKSELIILLKPTIVHGDRNWQDDLAAARERIRALRPSAGAAQERQ